jgi:DNA-directed RNA polymerase specialized sigma24 family protein
MLNATEIDAHAEALLPAMQAMYRKLCSNPADAKDRLHDGYIYLRTYCLPAYKGGSTVKTFALQSLRRHYIDWTRAHVQSKTCAFHIDEDGNGGPDAVISNDVCIVALAIEAERLDTALGLLSAHERALCEAFVVHGEWNRAAAAIGVSGVKASRMLKKIRAKLGRKARPARRIHKLTPR